MPLIILGLIVILGIVIYGLVLYGRSDEPDDSRPVRERFSHLSDIFGSFRKEPNYTIIEDDDEDETDGSGKTKAPQGGGNTMYFPLDAESEKRKRNIK